MATNHQPAEVWDCHSANVSPWDRQVAETGGFRETSAARVHSGSSPKKGDTMGYPYKLGPKDDFDTECSKKWEGFQGFQKKLGR